MVIRSILSAHRRVTVSFSGPSTFLSQTTAVLLLVAERHEFRESRIPYKCYNGIAYDLYGHASTRCTYCTTTDPSRTADATRLIELVRHRRRILVFVLTLAAGGYPWTVIPVERRDDYMAALEAGSTRQDIAPFAAFLGGLVQDGLDGRLELEDQQNDADNHTNIRQESQPPV